jgi:hypothetical protein
MSAAGQEGTIPRISSCRKARAWRYGWFWKNNGNTFHLTVAVSSLRQDVRAGEPPQGACGGKEPRFVSLQPGSESPVARGGDARCVGSASAKPRLRPELRRPRQREPR